jgi:hypothetical protein
MGKGGEQSSKVKEVSACAQHKLKLNQLATEELRKWAKSYGLPADLDRDSLLVQLVNLFSPNCHIIHLCIFSPMLIHPVLLFNLEPFRRWHPRSRSSCQFTS